jgi:hypothetical protein
MKYELSSQGLAQLRKPVSAALGKCAPRLNRYGEKETLSAHTHTGCVRYTAVRAAD